MAKAGPDAFKKFTEKKGEKPEKGKCGGESGCAGKCESCGKKCGKR